MRTFLLITLFGLMSAPLMAQSTATVKETAAEAKTKTAKPRKSAAKKSHSVKNTKAAGKKMRGRKYAVTSLSVDYNGAAVSTVTAAGR